MRESHNGGGAGSLTAVGLGPGDPELLAPMALAALDLSGVIVGYKGYIDLLSPEVLEGKEVYSTGMTGEVERCRKAVDLAVSGERVAVVCSGDSGIYAMSGLLMEIAEGTPGGTDLDFSCVPGIPALVGAAALLGAPLMHDFASVSLSDLLTDWGLIEKRLDAAAGADFVIGLYNPRSRKRDWQLGRALEIIASHRDGKTPVGMVKNAFRPGQETVVETLAGFDPALVDMHSLLIVGNSSTRISGGRMLTPRGYGGKYDLS